MAEYDKIDISFCDGMRLMEVGYENADITIITDGKCRISDSFAESFRNAIQMMCH